MSKIVASIASTAAVVDALNLAKGKGIEMACHNVQLTYTVPAGGKIDFGQVKIDHFIVMGGYLSCDYQGNLIDETIQGTGRYEVAFQNRAVKNKAGVGFACEVDLQIGQAAQTTIKGPVEFRDAAGSTTPIQQVDSVCGKA
jgi:hypothetical protein